MPLLTEAAIAGRTVDLRSANAAARDWCVEVNVEKQFCALGSDAQAFLVGAAAIGNTRLGSELEILLALGAAHGEQALIAVLHRAVGVPAVPRR